MDGRNQRLLQLLCENREFIPIVVLADALAVSEKTVRSDLKALNAWLMKQDYSINIVRKPGTGVRLQGEEDQIRRSRTELAELSAPPEKEMRQLQLILFLLEFDKFVTIQYAADKFFVSKTTVANDLDDIERELEAFGLAFIRKPHLGIKLEGEEEAWRRTWRTMIHRLAGSRPDAGPGKRFYGSGCYPAPRRA
ncbi:helix-turn-helix domain-containing protein [Paenibacillus sp. P26]|nr:helix-turn-helix domain-containing protein [Paenibacillus sp. P26]